MMYVYLSQRKGRSVSSGIKRIQAEELTVIEGKYFRFSKPYSLHLGMVRLLCSH